MGFVSLVSFVSLEQTSQNRFWMLPFLCKRWPGPISIAILEEDREVSALIKVLGVSVRRGEKEGLFTGVP